MNATAIKLTIKIWHDDCPDDPSAEDGWTLYSFSRRHGNYRDPESFQDDMEFRAKLSNGLAFPLSYYEHGQCLWALVTELPVGTNCPWDSVGHAGFIVWEQDEENIGAKTVDDRKADARSMVDRFTQWSNGEVYGYTVEAAKVCECCKQDVELTEEEADMDLPSCSGYYPGDIEGMVIDIKDRIGNDWADYEVSFVEQHPYGVADEVEKLWNKKEA